MSAYWQTLVAGALDGERTRHRPANPEAAAREIRRLEAAGLLPDDISQVMAILPDVVLEILARPTDGENV